jgi:hypothetical protein
MKLEWICGLTVLALSAATGAACAPNPASHVPASQGTPVTEVVVPGGPPPKVSASYPADGAAVPAGTLVLKIVFDRAMTADGWSYGRTDGGAFPKCLQRPRLLGDKRTFVLLCTVAAHQTYALEINAPRDFIGEDGRKAKPTLLHFSTTEVGPRDIHDALVLAGLTDVDDPVMTWHDNGAGVSQSEPPPPADSPP